MATVHCVKRLAAGRALAAAGSLYACSSGLPEALPAGQHPEQDRAVSEVPVGGITFDLDQLYRLVAGIQRAHENLDLAGALLRLVSLANRVTLTGDLNAQTQNDPATHPFGVWSDLARYLAWFLNAPPTVQAEVVRHIGSTMDLARRASTATWPDTGAEE